MIDRARVCTYTHTHTRTYLLFLFFPLFFFFFFSFWHNRKLTLRLSRYISFFSLTSTSFQLCCFHRRCLIFSFPLGWSLDQVDRCQNSNCNDDTKLTNRKTTWIDSSKYLLTLVTVGNFVKGHAKYRINDESDRIKKKRKTIKKIN